MDPSTSLRMTSEGAAEAVGGLGAGAELCALGACYHPPYGHPLSGKEGLKRKIFSS